MTSTALALSPHLDDAVFSAGGTLAGLAAAGWRVVVATAFTRSVPNPTGFALACQTDKGLAQTVDYMAVRRAEDDAAMQALGARPVWLPFVEAPHRGYDSAPALFAGLRTDDDVVAELRSALARLVEEHRPDLLLAPQAIGGHVDHVQVVRSLPAGRPVLWWRDFPYDVREDAPAKPFEAKLRRLPEAAVELHAGWQRAKRAACHAYRSQLGFQFGGAAGLDARLDAAGTVERFRIEGALPACLGTERTADA